MTLAQQPEHEGDVGDSGGSSRGERFANLSTPWFTLIGEHIQAEGQVLDYWRVEKADSVVVLPIQGNQLLLPVPFYRPGIGCETLDFPGGRCGQEQDPAGVAGAILERELGVEAGEIMDLQSINARGWAVNSSFSNQRLYGFVARLTSRPVGKLGGVYEINAAGVERLRAELQCLQCRMVLLEWWQSSGEGRS